MKIFVLLGSLNALLAVALGAFGAHALKNKLVPEMLNVWQTGVQYHLVHALGLLVVGILCHLMPGSTLVLNAGWLLLAGIVLFSGSLYLLALSGVTALGMITPFGGIAFLSGWLLLIAAAWKDLP